LSKLKKAIYYLLGIRYSIIQGGMVHLATAELASAVSDASGLDFHKRANKY
jgi:NAD(P)H-dependent flavin oxidoreductase YrpB (nitropropane dioxygenase family)